MEVRKISNSRIDYAVDLIWTTFLQFEAPDYSDEGVNSFKKFIEDENTIKKLEVFGAYEGDKLTGVIAVNENRSHICCFFVKAEYQRQGIGRMLWEYLLSSSRNLVFTVNSSPYAVPFYHKLGFVDIDVEQLTDGIRYTPMCFKRKI